MNVTLVQMGPLMEMPIRQITCGGKTLIPTALSKKQQVQMFHIDSNVLDKMPLIILNNNNDNLLLGLTKYHSLRSHHCRQIKVCVNVKGFTFKTELFSNKILLCNETDSHPRKGFTHLRNQSSAGWKHFSFPT